MSIQNNLKEKQYDFGLNRAIIEMS